jgi:hypothetical protein
VAQRQKSASYSHECDRQEEESFRPGFQGLRVLLCPEDRVNPNGMAGGMGITSAGSAWSQMP